MRRFDRRPAVTRSSENLRGGMIHRSYRAQFEKKAVALKWISSPEAYVSGIGRDRNM